jgi:hypothetical protein
LADVEINNQSQVADDYLSALSLSYVTEARCYLELNEWDTAERRLQEGVSVLRPRFEHHTKSLLTSNPAAYLHPSLIDQIDFKRLAKVCRWLTPGVDDYQLFETQRKNLFTLAQNPAEWVGSLPQAIRMPVKNRYFHARMIAEITKQLNTRDLAKRVTGLVTSIKNFSTSLLKMSSLACLRPFNQSS